MCYYEEHIVASTWLLTKWNSQSENVLQTIVNHCLLYFIYKKTQQWYLWSFLHKGTYDLKAISSNHLQYFENLVSDRCCHGK